MQKKFKERYPSKSAPSVVDVPEMEFMGIHGIAVPW